MHPLVSCSGQPQRGLSLAVGRSGSVIEVAGDRATPQAIPGDPDLASVSLDIIGHAWAAASGRIWQRREGSSWRLAWEDRSWTAPFVTLWSDVGIVYAMTVD